MTQSVRFRCFECNECTQPGRAHSDTRSARGTRVSPLSPRCLPAVSPLSPRCLPAFRTAQTRESALVFTSRVHIPCGTCSDDYAPGRQRESQTLYLLDLPELTHFSLKQEGYNEKSLIKNAGDIQHRALSWVPDRVLRHGCCGTGIPTTRVCCDAT